MMTRRDLLRRGTHLTGFAVSTLLVATGCASAPFISELDVGGNALIGGNQGHVIVPDGSGIHDEADVYYTLNKRAEVGATLLGADGRSYEIRAPQLRAPDRYMIPFRGLVRVPNTNWLRVLPDGTYTLNVTAKDIAGATITRQTSVTIQKADTSPPQINDVVVNPPSFSPNGDGIEDTVRVSYSLSKEAKVRVYATDKSGGFSLIQAEDKQHAALQSFEWTGTSAGGNTVLPDGDYTIHIEATDLAGNFTDATTQVTIAQGGTPRVEITEARFTPTALAFDMPLSVSVTVRNTGTVPVRTLGPPPGTEYTTEMNFSSFLDPNDKTRALYFERPGVWRVGVSWENAPQPYPVRWGFFADDNKLLMPGDTATITGTIRVQIKTQHEQVFYAGLEQGGVGFPVAQVGLTRVTISF
jgi:hypothetical protein